MSRDDDHDPTATLGPDGAGDGSAAAPVTEEVPLMPGDCLGRYTVREILGAGAMGEVFAAEDPELGRVVALKVMRGDHSAEARIRFQREARAMARLNHPNVVAVYDVGVAGERSFVAMELVEGPTLSRWLIERPRGWREIHEVFVQAARGLEAAHAAGLVHRDFKPSNVLVGERVRVADFGLARAYSADERPGPPSDALDGVITVAGGTPGTPAYMAPEQRAGSPGPLADQYSFAVALHEALYGVRPGSDEPPLTAPVPRWLRAIVERALRQDPRQRYPSMARLLADLERGPRRGRRRWLAAAALVAVAGTATVLTVSRTADDPLAGARFSTLADLEGVQGSAAISRDGEWLAFLSDRDGPTDVWLTKLGTGELANLTRGEVGELVNPSIRTLSFSPDGTQVLFWVRRGERFAIWSAPVTGGAPAPYRDGAAELAWSPDGRRLAYHTPDPGDPLFLEEPGVAARRVFVAPSGQHGHYPTWSSDGKDLYLVLGVLPGELDVWRLPGVDGPPERLTFHSGRVRDPTPVDTRTLLYLATAPDGSGPWLHALDLEQRKTRRLAHGVDQYTSLAASGDGRRLVATVSRSSASLWRSAIADGAAQRIELPTRGGRAPRFVAGGLVFVAAAGEGDTLWKLAGAERKELWRGTRERILGGPAISPDGRAVAFATESDGTTRLRTVALDGTGARLVSEALELRGSPAWAPDGQALIIAVVDDGVPRLHRIGIGGAATRLVAEESTDPAWSPDGRLLFYSGRDVGTRLAVSAVGAEGAPAAIPPLALVRGARRIVVLAGGKRVVVLRGDLQHKDLWLVDLETGSERQLTRLDRRGVVRDFDVSPDGSQIVFDRVSETSDVVVIDRVSGR